MKLQGRIFLSEINHWLFMHLFPMLIFFNMISSQSDETGILDVLEIEFFEKKKNF